MFGSRSCSASHDGLDREVVGVEARSARQYRLLAYWRSDSDVNRPFWIESGRLKKDHL